MARPRQRVCLQDGLKLDLDRLARKGFVRHGANIGGRGTTWTHSYWGDIATGMISADMSSNNEGWFRIQLGSLDQWITLIARPRHFGGRQWYALSGIGSSLSYGSRPGRHGSAAARPGAGKSPINPNSTTPQIGPRWKGADQGRLIANLDPDEWDLPPKPKWMRWATYNRYSDQYDRYEDVLDRGCMALAAKFFER